MFHPMDIDTLPILPSCGTSAITTPTFTGYNGPTPVIWEQDWGRKINEQLGIRDENTVAVEMASPVSMNVVKVYVTAVPKKMMVAGGGVGRDNSQRGRTQAKKKLAGVQRSRTSSSKARRAVVDGVVNKASRREGRLAVIDDDELGSWDSRAFVDPRPAPAPPALLYNPPPWRTGGKVSTQSGTYTSPLHGTKSSRKQRFDALSPLAPSRGLFDGAPAPPIFQQPTPTEPVRLPFLDSPLQLAPKQTFGRETVPLPTVSASGPLVIGQTTGTYTGLYSPSIDSSMDRVYVQIQDCLVATERMDQTLLSCNYIKHGSVGNLCSELKRSLREMQRTIDQGSSCVELDTPEKLVWSRKREAVEFSVQKNVRKYYQLATQTAKKPPRINHLDSRMDKLHAYLRKFKDLNVRILASYDTLRILELRAQLSTAYSKAKQRKEAEVAHQHEWNQSWRMEKKAMEELKHDILVVREARSTRLMRLMDLKYSPLSSMENVL